MSKTARKYIKLNDVRLSFPSLVKPSRYKNLPEAKPYYGCTFILDKVKHVKEISELQEELDFLLEANKLNKSKIKDDYFCLKDGDLLERPEYKNSFILRSKSTKKPTLLHKDAKTEIEEENNPFYGGCYVTAHVKPHYYSEITVGIGCLLRAVQFRKDGSTFDGFNIEGAFDAVEDNDDLPF